MMGSKVKFSKDPLLTYNGCVAGILDGKTQKQIIKELGITKPTLKDHLAQKDTSWGALVKQYKSKKDSKSQNDQSKLRGNIQSNEPTAPPVAVTATQADGSASPDYETIDDITEETYKTYVLRLANEKEPSPAVANLMFNLLKESKGIEPSVKEQSEKNEEVKRYMNEVLKNVYT